MLNRVTLIGNLGKDPEVRRLENGTPVAKFTLATNESYKDPAGEWQQLTEWHEVVLWRNNAEYAEKFLKRGSLVFIEGKITHRKYTDKAGVERYTTEIVANICRSFEKREGVGGRESAFPSQESPYATTVRSTAYSTPTHTGESQRPPIEIEVVPPPAMTDAPNAEGGNDLPF